jgi:hypothetical protein
MHCVCKFRPEWCYHATGPPTLPISRTVVSTAVEQISASSGVPLSLYSLRRLHCVAVAKISLNEHNENICAHIKKSAGIRARVNNQLNWVSSSHSFLEYCQGFQNIEVRGVEVFKPITRYYLFGEH